MVPHAVGLAGWQAVLPRAHRGSSPLDLLIIMLTTTSDFWPRQEQVSGGQKAEVPHRVSLVFLSDRWKVKGAVARYKGCMDRTHLEPGRIVDRKGGGIVRRRIEG